MKLIEHIDREIIRQEWDNFAFTRHKQLLSGKDISFIYVLVPIILKLIGNIPSKGIIDVGCGSGVLTKILGKSGKQVIGIDPSRKSIALARKLCKDFPNISFVESYAEDFHSSSNFDLAVSNMVFMDAVNISAIFNNISAILSDNGYLLFTITHPCFWPIYWNYFNKKWFDYYSEIPIRSNFVISAEKSKYETTHIHRPLNMYIKELNLAGFTINEIREPFPDNKPQESFYKYRYPRFIAFLCSKRK